jgi:hypothetical protein
VDPSKPGGGVHLEFPEGLQVSQRIVFHSDSYRVDLNLQIANLPRAPGRSARLRLSGRSLPLPEAAWDAYPVPGQFECGGSAIYGLVKKELPGSRGQRPPG